MSFPFFKQFDSMDCGPTCLRMVAKYFGKNFSLQYLRNKCQIQRDGVSLLDISEAAESIGLRTIAVKLDFNTLSKNNPVPCIVHWDQNHFVVVYKIKGNFLWIADPAKGKIKLTKKDFEERWLNTIDKNKKIGVALLLDTTPSFNEIEEERNTKVGVSYLLSHFKKHKRFFSQLSLCIFIGIIFQSCLPFLAQSIVDIGINNRDTNFITLVLIGQMAILVGNLGIDFIKSWILLFISTRVNISLLTDFFVKLMRLPMSYFDLKMTGDILQRMTDHNRLQTFVTSTLLGTLFSLINFLVFTFIVIAYNIELFFVFIIFSILYFGWIMLFLKKRKNLDFKNFELSSKNQNLTIELIQGMQEIKLNNSERQKRWLWENLQSKIFKQKMRSLFINQSQMAGAQFINHGKNILITFLTAREVIRGELSIGGMVAIQYILGQLNNPVSQLVQFFQSYQDAKISIERINEIHQLEDEEPISQDRQREIPNEQPLHLRNLGYKYPGFGNDFVLRNLDFEIPQGKTTAIVGTSGSGKTTLIKLMLRYYDLTEGELKVGNEHLKNISPSYWRSKCGVVSQEGFIFSDSISANIAVGETFPDLQRLQNAIRIANLSDFINILPLGLATKVGSQGNGISQGQKQRLLIARAVYKDPDFIFLDEATNALDASNELIIMNNLQEFFKGKTVVIAAHRLSTVKNADQIIVLEKGKMVERGTHHELAAQKRNYFQLVKNQLELGN